MQDLNSAQHSVSKLKPLAEALAAVDDQSLNNNPEAIQKFNDFCDFTSLKLMEAAAIVARAQKQYKDRDQDLIAAAILRTSIITNEIANTIFAKENLLAGYEIKKGEMKKQSFSEAEILAVIGTPTADAEALDAQVESLQAEKVMIERFLSDAPRFDADLLAETKVLDLLQTRQDLGMSAVKM